MKLHPFALPFALALTTACGSARDSGLEAATGGGSSQSCTRCHGSGDDPAPPRSVRGATATSEVAVGAHQQHLRAGPLHEAIACRECHAVPTSTSHMDGKVTLTFGPTATAGGAAAAWDPATATCATYCHGATLGGGRNTAPVWTKVDGSQASCGSCHGLPPPAPHVQSTACGACHPGYAVGGVDPALHVNGRIDLSGGACSACHGDAARATNPAAPPRDASGNVATTAIGVGAHQAHLAGARLGKPIACAECHTVPQDTSHVNGRPDVAFGALARTGGVTPAWDRGAATCATYCHGATLAGGAATRPVWTKVDGTQVACSSCHGAPPPAPHPQNVACAGCHAGYTGTSVNAATHLDGSVDVAGLTCSSCHGDAARAPVAGADPNLRAAPPVDSRGNAQATARGVGAHQAHLNRGTLARPLACAECHTVPASTGHSDGAVQVAIAGLGATGGVSASWNGATCATYCHGATLPGGTNRTPSWTGGAAQAACGTCHGAPPPAPHVQNTSCGGCHGPGYSSTRVNAATHVNGTLDLLTLTCSSCHGDPGRASGPKEAPPADTKGSTATTARGVGAHQSHLSARIAPDVACGECHVVPASTGHADGTVQVALAGRARAGGVTPAWTGTTCATYCHGATLTGGSNRSPAWTTVNGSQAACGTCHGLPPSTGEHGQGEHRAAGCGACHPGYSSSVNAALHVNAAKDVGGAGTRIQSWSAATRSCSPACHGQETW